MKLKVLVIVVVCMGVLIGYAHTENFLDDKDIEKAAKIYGDDAKLRLNEWQKLIYKSQAKSRTEMQRLGDVNQFFNQLTFIDDVKLWGLEDYWATPIEFIGAKGGDCEDFSIAKYFTLRELGVSDEKIRLIYVKALSLDQFHMVVAYYPEPSSIPYILDNIDPDMKLATQREDLVPIYSFNAQHLWLMKERGRGQLTGKSTRLSKWTLMRDRYSRGDLKVPAIRLSY
ncbi:sulfate adenylyltransferase [Photobacterium aquae]|uniref:Sulfate adenylyltransferase n=1 Tax=Photobacterium aquae TaxID=1195763 RepID=A0A0J1GP38_9GAMM|nr:transglutaminase-like cysteine peptidase [Photobacterium aquae]KLV01386.1 sulfate adenylyltransferase [Photobacterium aquae]